MRDRIASVVGALFGARGKSDSADLAGAEVRQIFGYGAGLPLAESQSPAEQVRRNKHWVYAAVRAISDAVGEARLRFFVETAAGRTELLEVRPDHPLIELWRRPNPLQSSYALKKLAASSLELTGDAYLWKERGPLGAPARLWFLRPQSVTLRGGAQGVASYAVRESGEEVVIPAADVIHLYIPDLRSRSHGIAPLQAATQAANAHDAIHGSQDVAFQQGINPSAVVSVDGQLDAEQQSRLRESIERLYRGSSRHGRILIKDKRTRIEPWSRTPVEMNYLESMRASREEILGVFGVPAAVVGLAGDVNRASALAMERVFAQRSVRPLLRLIADALTLSLCPDFDRRIVAEFDDSGPTDQEMLLQALEQGLKYGVIKPNEWRRELGWGPDPEGDDFWRPSSHAAPGSPKRTQAAATRAAADPGTRTGGR